MRRDFRLAEVEEALGWVAGAWPDNQDVERIQAAVVLAADGDLAELRRQVRELRIDWRDVLMAGGLGYGDWPEVLDRVLGPVS